jgi:hypothetical protein
VVDILDLEGISDGYNGLYRGFVTDIMHYIYILDLDGIYRGFPMTFIHSKPQMPMPTRISKR